VILKQQPKEIIVVAAVSATSAQRVAQEAQLVVFFPDVSKDSLKGSYLIFDAVVDER
jgi:hypothetical protein